MPKVNNAPCVRRIAIKSLKTNKTRNIVAILAITLTCVLFTSVFTTGMSMLESMQREIMHMVGTTTHGGYKYLTISEYEHLAADREVAEIGRRIIVGEANEEALKKLGVELSYSDEFYAQSGFDYPSEGRMPQSGNELATSYTVAQALGGAGVLGEELHLHFRANGAEYEDTFTLVGLYEADPGMPVNQIYVSEEYQEAVAPAWQVPHKQKIEEGLAPANDPSYMAGMVQAGLNFSTSFNIETQMEELSERLGFEEPYIDPGVNWAYATAEIDISAVLLVVVLCLIILLTGYLIVYNIFLISVSRDVLFYGQLKTVGTTAKQLRHILRLQVFFLSLPGMVLGVLLGVLLAYFLLPFIMQSTILKDDFVLSVHPAIFVFSALFTQITVFVSLSKPYRFLSRISPIEAIRYSGVSQGFKVKNRKSKKATPLHMALQNAKRTKKKTVLVVLSLCLSIVVFDTAYTIANSFDLDVFLENYAVTDFQLGHYSQFNSIGYAEQEAITEETLLEIEALQGLESLGKVYISLGSHVLGEEAYTRAIEYYHEKNTDFVHPVYDAPTLELLGNEQSLGQAIYGLSPELYDTMDLPLGDSLDTEKFHSGDYVFVSSFFTSGEDPYYLPGDKVTLTFENGNSKEYEVLAIGSPAGALDSYIQFGEIEFTLPESEYRSMMGETNPMLLAFDVDEEYMAETEAFLENYTENVNPDLQYSSKALLVEEFEGVQSTYLVAGGMLSFILALVGVLNFVNMLVMSVDARKREFAVLQSIGMTKTWLLHMLVCEGGFYAVLASMLTISVGKLLSYVLTNALAGQIWFFRYHFTLFPLAVSLPLLFVVCGVLPLLMYRLAKRKSIVERLQEV